MKTEWKMRLFFVDKLPAGTSAQTKTMELFTICDASFFWWVFNLIIWCSLRFGLTSGNVSSDAKSRNRLSLIIFPCRNICLPNKARGISIKAMLGLCWGTLEVDKQTTSIVSQVQQPSTARCNVNSRENDARRRKLAFPSGLIDARDGCDRN